MSDIESELREKLRELEQANKPVPAVTKILGGVSATMSKADVPSTAAADFERTRSGGIKCRLTLGPALIDFEGSLEETVQIITRLTQEFGKSNIIPALSGG